jgi:hypothetical protein
MSTTNLRYFQLMAQVEKNPLRPAVAGAFDIASDFSNDVARIAADRRLSPEGRRDATQDLVRKAVRDLRDIGKPLHEFRSKTETMRAAVKRPAYDKTDLVAALNRKELRDASRAMTSGQRAGKLTGEKRSVAFIDALLEFPDDPWLAGVDIFSPSELQVFEAAKEERLRDLNGPVLDTIAERENTLEEVAMIVAVARVDIQGASGLDSQNFEAVAQPIETRVGAPWLMEDGKTICEIVNGKAEYHLGSPDELRDAVKFENEAAFLASRRAA